VKFTLEGRVYDAASIYHLPLKLILQLQMESREFGRQIELVDIQTWTAELDKLKTDRERAQHPSGPWLIAVAIWVARKKAGDDVTFDQAVDVPLDEIVWLKEPRDYKQNPTKARPRKGSGPAVKRAPSKVAARTSRAASTAG
jgi:hypothetical protein